MECPSCGHGNRQGRKFCASCGTPLAVRCPSCGEQNEPGERFCGECGGSLDDRRAQATTPVARGTPESVAAGRYEIKRFLGEGGRKRVYLAHDKSLDRDVALALIKTEGLDETAMTRARREAEAMGRLGDHPHVVTVYDIGEDQGQLYVVSQFMAGGDLDDLVGAAEGHRLPVDRAVDIAGQVCHALEHAHAHGVVHRDVKPKNVWLTKDGTAKLGDFGLAMALDRSRITLEGMMVGTVAYMPPEQSLGRPADARSDLYSLGALLYELVCGRPPFVGDDAVAIISQHINTAPVAPSWSNSEIPRVLDELILKMLAKAPDERPQSASTVRETLETLSSGELVAPAPIVHDRASPLDRLASGVFVGRERETEELRSSLEATLSGRGRAVMVAGEMGIGKTRLASELATYASLRGAKVLWGQCYEGEGAPSYWPWVQIVRSYAHDRDPKALSSEMGTGAVDIAQVVSEVRDLLPGLPQPAAGDPEQARFRLFDAITTFLKNAAESSPLVLILDDLQWADRASFLLLQFVAAQLRGSRILLVGTYREADIDDDHPLSEVLVAMRRDHDHKRISLRGLPIEEVTTLLEASAEHELGPREIRIARLMHDQTEGNPFFIEEVIRHLTETGQLSRREGRWVIDVENVDEVGIPEGVKETIGRRLGRLGEKSLELLAVAAVIGREFGIDQLERVTRQEPRALLEQLDEAARARVIAERRGTVGGYRFVNGLTRETLHERLSTSRRVTLHSQVVEALESLHAESIEAHLPELAYHASEAVLVAGPDKAIDYGIRAGARAGSMLAYEDSVTYYEAALHAMGQQYEDGRRLEVQLALGDACWRTGDFSRACEVYEGAAAIAKKLGAPEQLAAAALGHGGGAGFDTGQVDETLIGLLEDARDALGEGDDPLQARVTSRLAEALAFSEARDRSKRLASEAVEMARRVGDPGALAYALTRWHLVGWGPDTLDERLAAASEAIELADGAGDAWLQLEATAFLIGDLLESGDIEAVDRLIEELKRGASKTRVSYHLWFTAVAEAMQLLLWGRFEEAGKRALEALTVGQEARHQNALQFYGAQFSLQRRELGQAEGLIEGATAFVEQQPGIPAWRCARTFYLSDYGRADEARIELDELAADGFAAVPHDMFWFIAICLLAQTTCNLDDEDRAATLYEMLTPYADRYCVIPPIAACYGSVSRNLGQLATVLGRFEDAAHHFETAIEMNTKIGSPGWVAHCQADFARLLLERDAAGDREKAVELLGEALDTARELKMRGLTEQVLALKLEAHGGGQPPLETSIESVVESVEAEPPDLRPHAAPDGTVTLLFSDIQNSTAMTESLGDNRWLELLRKHNRIVGEEVRAHGGFEVKSQGDGFMLAFPSASRALLCAVGIQRAIHAYGEQHPAQRLHVRIGLHTGEAIREGDDFFGRHVILAARIAAEAKGGEILISGLLKQLVESSGEWEFGEERSLELKGLKGTHRVCAVQWQPESAPVAT